MDNSGGGLGYPQWTTKKDKRGLDPLGLQTASIALYQRLVPGISNVTLRMRYYGLYAWLAQRYAHDVGDTSEERWCLYLRRAEALFALASVHAGGEVGVAGFNWAEGALAGPGPDIIFSHATDRAEGEPQYLKQKFGAYGAAYGSQLLDIGILETVRAHNIPVPTLAIGEPLANAFHAAIGEAADVFLAATKNGAISKADLTRLHSMLPSRIGSDSLERDLYEKLLFEAHQGPSRAASRSQSLKLVLRIAQAQGKVDVATIRWRLYASQCNAASLAALSADEIKQRFAWAVYQANELMNLCYESIFKVALDILEAAPIGLTHEDLVGQTVSRLMEAVQQYTADSWMSLCGALPLSDDPFSDKDAQSELSLHRAVLQSARLEAITDDDSIRASIVLLGVLYKRFNVLRDDIAKELSILTSRGYLRWLVTEFDFLNEYSEEPLQVLFTYLVKRRVLDRHWWVAIQKLKNAGDYTFLFEFDDGRLRLRQKEGPVFTNPRLATTITFLKDVHLLNASGITPAGLRLLETA